MAMNLLPVIVLFPITMALILNLLHENEKLVKYLTYILSLILIFLPFIGSFGYYYFGGHGVINGYTTGIAYFYNVGKQVLLLILSFIVSISLITGMGEKFKNNMFVVLTLMGYAGISAIILSDDLFNLYVFFEIVSMVQAGLVFLSGTEESYKAGLRYLLIGVVAGSLMLLGITIIIAITGSLNISDIKYYILDSPLAYVGSILLIIGLAYSSGIPPFHNIKVDLYSRAKGFISAVLQTYSKFIFVALSIIIIKIFSGLSFFSSLKGILIALSVISMVFGTVLAILEDDYKRLLAYSSISHLGFVGIGIALSSPLAILAGIFHAINSVVFKSGLFLSAYIVSNIRGPKLLNLGGLIKYIPFTAFFTLLLIFSAVGVPPFGGYVSKLLLIREIMPQFPEIAGLMILISVGSFVYLMKAFYLIFLAPNKEDYNDIRYPKVAYYSLVILSLLSLILGIFSNIILNKLFTLVKI